MKYLIWIIISALLMGISIDIGLLWRLFIPSLVSLIVGLIVGLIHLPD